MSSLVSRSQIANWKKRKEAVRETYRKVRERAARARAILAEKVPAERASIPRGKAGKERRERLRDGTRAAREALRADVLAARATRDQAIDEIRVEREAAFELSRTVRAEMRGKMNPKRQAHARRVWARAWEEVKLSCRANVPPEYVAACERGGIKLAFAARKKRREPAEMFIESLHDYGIEQVSSLGPKGGALAFTDSGNDFQRPYQDKAFEKGAGWKAQLANDRAMAEEQGIEWDPAWDARYKPAKKSKAAAPKRKPKIKMLKRAAPPSAPPF
jgi:hypothetical protein